MDKIIPMPSENVTDIREYKKDLRAQCKSVRSDMPPEVKSRRDSGIFERIISSSAYKQASIILTYVSTDIEVDTYALIQKAI